MPRISWTDIKIFVLRVAKYWCTRGAELLVQMEKQSIISRKFANCSINVVVFKTYCSCLYTSQLWGTCLSRTMNRLKVAYNESLRMVLGIPRYCSAS